MLIKRPKESARKMLKSHSLSNLSVSDPQLYRQFNGLQLSQVHHPGPIPANKVIGRRSTDEQSVTSNETDRSEPRRRYVSAKGKENWKQQRPGSDSIKSPDSYHSDSSSIASEYQYVSRRDRERDRQGRRRGDMRYASIPEDAQEINNNSGSKDHGGPMYHSCHDLSFASQASSAPTNNSRVLDQSRHDQVQGRHNQDQGRSNKGQGHPSQIANDQMYRQRSQREHPSESTPVHDPGDMDDVARSKSLGNLSTGLTFSVVGQRKADSMLDLSSPARPPPQGHNNGPPRHPRDEGRNYHPPEHVRTDNNKVLSPRHSYPDSVYSPRSSSSDDVFVASPRHSTNGYFNGVDHHQIHNNLQQQKHHPQQKHPNGYHKSPYAADPRDPRGRSQHQHQQQHNGYAYHNSSSNSSTPQSDSAPPKPKRSLPNVPLNETSERIKRFTEMMRSRMSVCSSSAGRSTANSTLSQTPTTPHTPPSRQASIADNSSDFEVSTLLREPGYLAVQKRPVEGGHGGERSHPQQHQHNVGEMVSGGEGRAQPRHNSYPSRHQPSSQEMSQSYSEHLCESGQTPFTSHSHSSTMDSGYTTNTEGDGDSTANTSHHHLSPPHHHNLQYSMQHHQQPRQNNHSQAAGEVPRQVPVARNLSLAAARKFSSMQNVSSVHNQNSHGYPSGPPQHPAEWGSYRNPQPKGPAPMRAQHPADYHAAAEHQRRSWDLAHNFKSLDFMPVVENGQMNGHHAQGHEDHVVKPQAVSVSGGSVKLRTDPHNAQRTESQKRCGSKNNGQVKRSSSQDYRVKDYSQLPAALEASGMNTLPGHWKYNNTNNGNMVNNNVNTTSSARNNNTAQTPPKSNSDCGNMNAPTLFQISQCFDLCSARLSLPLDVHAGRILSVSSLQVTLPTFSLDSNSTPVHSPQGRCARLGGPGSAFRPVRTGSRGGGQAIAELTAITSIDKQCQELCVLGEVHPGDLLMEVNGRPCVGLDVASVQGLLGMAYGELSLTIARKKEENVEDRVQQLENSLQKLQMEVKRMHEELSKKDSRIRELSTMLPWKQEDAKGESTMTLDPEEGAFVIGDNEFVV